MVEVHELDGYKIMDAEPAFDDMYRDNFIYISLTCNDWKHDQNMIMFLVNEHGVGVVAPLIEHMSQLVQDNRIPRLHITIWQHSIETRGEMQFAIGTEEPILVNWAGQSTTALEYIKGKHAYYDSIAAEEQKARERFAEYRRQAEEKQLARAKLKAQKAASTSKRTS